MRFITLLLFAFSLSVQAETRLIKYRNFLLPIPITADDTLNLFYIDDVADSRVIVGDPNGVQEIPILVGLSNRGLFNLVGVGASGDRLTFDVNFLRGLLSLSGDFTPAYVGIPLRDAIIDQALLLGSPRNRLVIAIGGGREVIIDAINRANQLGTPINDRIKVIGINDCNTGGSSDPDIADIIGTGVSNCRIPGDGIRIRNAIGDDNYTIIPRDENTSQLGIQPPSFEWFFDANLPHVLAIDNGIRNSWYQTHFHRTSVGRFFRDNRNNGFLLDEQNIVLNGCTVFNLMNLCNQFLSVNLVPEPLRFIFRGADFTSVAYAIWGAEIFSQEFETRMYREIEIGLATLP